MSGIGSFAIEIVIVSAAALMAWATARIVARRLSNVSHKTASSMILYALAWGLIAARLAHVTHRWEEYSTTPLTMIRIFDQGFSWWAGIVVAIAYLCWRTRLVRRLRGPVLVGVLVGVVAWSGLGRVIDLMQHSAPALPDLQLAALDERPISLSAYAGRPLVLNLWATWCPPCRREMPAFEQAQAAFPDVTFILINQGESVQQVKKFLETEGLNLANILLDPTSEATRTTRSRGLPTTLFFDAQGRMVDSHLGEITMPVLKNKLAHRLAPSAGSDADK